MSLKAGRVGVNPADVDPIDGHISPSATGAYTKQEADAKFETQTHASETYETKTDAAALQPKTLAVPISMLQGSLLVPKTTVEDVIQTMNNAMTNRELTEKVTVKTGTITSDFTIQDFTTLHKIGNVVYASIALSGVTKDAFTNALFNVPEGFRPKAQYVPLPMIVGNTEVGRCTVISVGGNVQSSVNLSNKDIYVSGSWITN